MPDPQFVSGRRACLSMFMMSVVVLLFASGIVALVVTIFNLTN
ncbi:MAG: hypothetical protein PF636_03370 [Actinomycetota bacterium]|nr:hypothetical protein [Actinomycetota bacterium]